MIRSLLHPRRRARGLVAAALGATTLWACTEGLTDGGRAPAPIGIVPSFQVVPPIFTAAPVDGIRLTARHASTLAIVGTTDESVDPAADEWSLTLSIETGDAQSLEVVVEVELLGGQTVLWSGRSSPFTVESGQSSAARAVQVYRGPLDNLAVTGVTIVEAPSQLMVGQTATLTATATVSQGSSVTPTIFWASSEPGVAAVEPEGPAVTVTAVSPGTVDLFAAAGPATDQRTLEVLPRVASVVVSPDPVTVPGADVTTQFSAAVTDGFGVPDPSAPVTWSSTNTSVAIVDGNGLATSVGPGTTEIRATSFGVVGSATLTVEGGPPPPPVDRTWVGGDASDPTNWHVAANWSPAGVPGSGDAVLIPQTTSNPILLQDATVASLVLSPSALLFLEGTTLTVTGDLVTIDAVISGGTVEIVGPGTQLEGLLPDVRIAADRTLTGFLFAAGSLTIDDAVVTMAGQSMQAALDFTVTGANGQLRMTDTGDVLNIAGSATFDGADHTGALTDGTMAVGGDLVVGAAAGAFVSSGTHQIIFFGSNPQVVTFPDPGPAAQRLQNVVLAVGSAVTFSTDAVVSGSVEVMGRLNVPAQTTTSIGGTLTLWQASTLEVNGTLTASGGCTNNGGTILGSGSQPCGQPAGADRVWQGGAAGAPSDWHTAANWLPSGVPAPTETVLVPSATNAPVLSGDVSVAGLVVEDFTTLDLGGSTLTVSGNLQAGQTIVNGQVVVTGAGTLLEGTVPDLSIQSNRTVSGTLIVTGDLALDNADLTIGANVVTVGGDFSVVGPGAQLIMQDPGGVLEISGNALFDGASTSGLLTAGSIGIGGDFTASATFSTSSYVASGTHFTVFRGTNRTVTFSNPATNLQRFQNLTIQIGGTLTFASDVVAMGLVIVDVGSVVDAANAVVSIGGGLVGIGLAPQELRVVGNLSAIPATLSTDVRVDASFTLPGSTAVTGNVTLNAGDLDLAGFTLGVGGDFTVAGGARLIMQNPAGLLDVGGDAIFDGAGLSGLMNAGTLRVAGDFTAGASSSTTSFVGSGTHTTVFAGTGTQVVSFSNPATTLQRFQDVAFLTGASVVFGSPFVAMGELTVEGGAFVDAANATVSVGGAFIDPGVGLTTSQLIVVGNLSAIPATVQTDVRVDASLTLPSSTAVTGDVTLNAGDLDIGGFTLGVAGDFTVTGGARLIMQDAAGVLDVDGDASFDGAGLSGLMNAGTLRVAGDFTASASSSTTSFVGSVAHTTVFDGTGTQVVTFSNPATNLQRFQNVTFPTGAGVVFGSPFVVMGALTVENGAFVDAANATVSVGGSFVDPGLGLTTSQLIVVGNLSAIPATVPADVRVEASFTLPSSVTVTGSVALNNGDLDVINNGLIVQGNFTVTGGARLIMQAVDGFVDVAGNATFDGAGLSGLLTSGTIAVAGDFTALATSAQTSFVGSGTHRVVLDGGGVQTVTFSNPGATLQRFFNLEVFNANGSVVFDTNAFVMGQLAAGNALLARPAGSTATLEVRGSVNLDVVTFDGLPLRIDASSAPASQVIDNVIFQNMDPTGVQLFIRLPGAAAGAALLTNSVGFRTQLSLGGLFVDIASSNGLPWTLQMASPAPTGLAGNEIRTDQFTSIVWPF